MATPRFAQNKTAISTKRKQYNKIEKGKAKI